MKWLPIRLPTPREPLWSMTQTWFSSSRQTSMKWFPVPSVPRCCTCEPAIQLRVFGDDSAHGLAGAMLTVGMSVCCGNASSGFVP